MGGIFWKTLLAFGALAIGGTSSRPLKSSIYDVSLHLRLYIYNIGVGFGNTYRLRRAAPQAEWEIKYCTGHYLFGEDSLALVLSYEIMKEEQEEAKVDNKEKEMEEKNEEEDKDQPKHLNRLSLGIRARIFFLGPRLIGRFFCY